MKTGLDLVRMVVEIVVDGLKDAGRMPSGMLYAALREHGCTLAQYEELMSTLAGAGVVRVENDVVIYTGK